MSAKDYNLEISALLNRVYIAKRSKREKDVMTDDRKEIERGHYIGILVQWIRAEMEVSDDNVVTIRENGKPIFEIRKV